MPEIWKLTRTQVQRVYLCARSKDGRPEERPRPMKVDKPAYSPQEHLRLVRRQQGWPEYKINAELKQRFPGDGR